MLDAAAIAALLPHSGRMCLLESVMACDAHTIQCGATSHRDPGNPLRGIAGLDVFAGIEYAAQAAALHGAISRNENAPRSGVLAALKNVDASRKWLHDCTPEIRVDVTLRHADPAGGVFLFSLRSGDEVVLQGQFTLMYTGQSTEAST